MFLTKQLSGSLFFNFMHYVQKNNLFLAKLPRISAMRIKMIDAITSRLLVIFPESSGKFPEILNFRKIYNPTNGQQLEVTEIPPHSGTLSVRQSLTNRCA